MDHHPRSTGRKDATRPSAVTRRWRTPPPRSVQEDPVHPDLYLIVYRQQERELESRLEHRRSQATRDASRPRAARRTAAAFTALAPRRRHGLA